MLDKKHCKAVCPPAAAAAAGCTAAARAATLVPLPRCVQPPAHHCVAARSCEKMRQERTMDRNCRMVMIRAKCRAPYCWMV